MTNHVKVLIIDDHEGKIINDIEYRLKLSKEYKEMHPMSDLISEYFKGKIFGFSAVSNIINDDDYATNKLARIMKLNNTYKSHETNKAYEQRKYYIRGASHAFRRAITIINNYNAKE